MELDIAGVRRALNEWAFRAKHLPGSEQFNTSEELFSSVRPDEEVVVYCTSRRHRQGMSALPTFRLHAVRAGSGDGAVADGCAGRGPSIRVRLCVSYLRSLSLPVG